jgi:hypothetical protein
MIDFILDLPGRRYFDPGRREVGRTINIEVILNLERIHPLRIILQHMEDGQTPNSTKESFNQAPSNFQETLLNY